jgi:aldehyde dehydrogenase (NAD+)/betaine-aldehyde dehydrogenase
MTTATDRLSAASRAAIDSPDCFIDGQWETGRGPVTTKLDPSTAAPLGEFQTADQEQVERAIAAARRSFDSGVWSRRAPAERSEVMFRLLDLLRDDYELLTEVVVADVGTPISFARPMQLDGALANFEWFARAAATGPDGWFEKGLPADLEGLPSASSLIRQPAGVVGAITAYNFPFTIAAWKLGGALAAGCSVVLLPSPRAALSTVALFRTIEKLGLPEGVVNLVLGDEEAGRLLSTDPAVDLVTFTGSAAVGGKVMGQAAPSLKKVVLELGGKSANLLLPGVDFGGIISPVIDRLVTNAGQRCGATSRILVQRDELDDFRREAERYVGSLKVGDPWDEDTKVGALIDERHRESVRAHVDRALAEGAEVLAGSTDENPLPGFYVNPLLLIGLDNGSEFAQEEQFGPVGLVIPYDTVDEAVAIANDSRYGLNANVCGETLPAIEVARRINAGTVTINGGGRIRPDAPWGGYGQSGVGREAGNEGFREFFEIKHVQWPL